MAEQLTLDLTPPSPPIPGLSELWTPDDIFAAFDERLIKQFGEDRRLERKSARTAPKDLADYLSMYANTQPHGGVIVIGVENDGEITGCKTLSTNQLNNIDLMGKHHCSDARSENKRVPVTNSSGSSDFVIAVRVYYRSDKLVETVRSEAFVREGNEKHRLTEAEKREVRINKGEVDYEKEPVQAKWPDDFDQHLVKEFCNEYVEKRGLTGIHSREDILCLNHLGTKTDDVFSPNLACVLLFSKDPRDIIPGARIRFLRYEGKEEGTGTRYNAIKDEFIDGPIPRQIEKIEEMIASQMRNFTRLGQDGRFYTKPEYPRDVWLEAAVNACVHRSYNLKNMVIFIKMFDDRMVFESPGGFPPPTTSENIYDSHNPRNPHLMEALFYLDFVKCAHEGTRRMRDLMYEVNLPSPEFEQKQVGTHQVHVTLRNNIEARKIFLDEDAMKIIGEALFNSLSEKEKTIINFIAERGKISVSDANRILQKDWRTAKNILERLVKNDVIERRTTGKVRDPKARYVFKRP